MTLIELSGAIFLLLITPGPTNTLLAVAGAERGFRGALRLIPAELAGYLTTVVPLAVAGGFLISAVPVLRPILLAVAALWVIRVGFVLWQAPAETAAPRSVDARRVFVTTLLNPKALIFGLTLLPAPAFGQLVLNLSIFAGQIVLVAAIWAGVGQGLVSTAGRLTLLRRIAAVWLWLVAAWLGWRAVTGG